MPFTIFLPITGIALLVIFVMVRKGSSMTAHVAFSIGSTVFVIERFIFDRISVLRHVLLFLLFLLYAVGRCGLQVCVKVIVGGKSG